MLLLLLLLLLAELEEHGNVRGGWLGAFCGEMLAKRSMLPHLRLVCAERKCLLNDCCLSIVDHIHENMVCLMRWTCLQTLLFFLPNSARVKLLMQMLVQVQVEVIVWRLVWRPREEAGSHVMLRGKARGRVSLHVSFSISFLLIAPAFV